MVLVPSTPAQPFTTTATTTTTTVPPPPASTGSAMAPPPSSSPAFTIREATPADVDAVTDVFFDAFAEDEIGRRVFPAGSRRARAEMRRSFADDLASPDCHKFVAVDPSVAEGPQQVIAVATWTPPGASWDRPPPAYAAAEKDEAADAADADDAPGDAALGAEFFAMMDRKHGEHVGGRRHWTLGFLAVRRAWQGRGVARPFVAWGCARADADGLDAYVQASPHAAPVYRRFGFEQIDAYAFRQIDYTEVFMLRKPRPVPADADAAAP